MKKPLFILAGLYVALFGLLWWTKDQLPDVVATHFNGSGVPDGWMSREKHLWGMVIFGVLFPGSIVGMCYAARFLPGRFLNVPNREYWTAPERRKEVYDFLFRHSLWLACLGVGFVIGIHWMIVEANERATPELSTGQLMVVIGLFLAGMVAWVVALILPLRKVPAKGG